MRYEYSVAGQQVFLDSSEELVAVRFRAEARPARRAAAVAGANVRYPDRIDVIDEGISILRVPPARGALGTQAATAGAAAAVLAAAIEVERVLPVFRVPAGVAVAAQRVLVRFTDASDSGAWLRTGAPGRSLLRCVDGQGGGAAATLLLEPHEDALAVARELAADPRLRYVEPAFINVLSKPRADAAAFAVESSAPRLDGQYAMRLTGASDAWRVHPGSPSVLVAVLDEGIDTLHADLPPIARSFDATDGDVDPDPNPWDNHGTACAGLAVAHGSDGSGVVGSGRGCGLMSVRIAGSPFPGADWQTANEHIANAITWAWQHGAAVLSNSWVGGAPSNRIAEAFDAARRHGRGGLGCVVVVAAGNGDGPVEFPGTLPGVLTVAASNQHDEPKTKLSRDGESWWGSSHGPQVDLAAPGVHNTTTDNVGPGGNICGVVEPGYLESFNGTSAATPIVAGAAALVLSANPGLTEVQVREILCGTAAKVGAVSYVDGHNDRMGHGRIDVLAAVVRALALR